MLNANIIKLEPFIPSDSSEPTKDRCWGINDTKGEDNPMFVSINSIWILKSKLLMVLKKMNLYLFDSLSEF